MSPTSFQTAPPRDIHIKLYLFNNTIIHHIVERIKWMEVDSNHRSNLQQIYSLSPLATRESIQINPLTRNGTYRARTCDPLLVRQMLSQLS